MRVLIGTYEESRSIWDLHVDLDRRRILSLAPAGEGRRCSYLTVRGGYCYAVSETPLSEGSAGALHSFRITREGLEAVDTLGGMPCVLPHLTVNRAGTALYTVSYGAGDILAVRLLPGGHFGGVLSHTVHSGKGIHPTRQTSAHPHSVWLDREERWLYVCDLGTDEILCWPLRADGGIELPCQRRLKLPGGYGVRHMALSPDGRWCYALCEMAYHLLVLRAEGDGRLHMERDVSLADHIPEEEQGGGAIVLSPDGKTLWCSNRGRRHSRLDRLSLEDPSFPRPLGEPVTQCQWPRDLRLSSDGEFLWCVNQAADSLSVFRRHPDSGGFLPFWQIPGVPSPACLLLLEEG